jgi:hypothetical protein
MRLIAGILLFGIVTVKDYFTSFCANLRLRTLKQPKVPVVQNRRVRGRGWLG